MARYTGPVCRLCRRMGDKLMLKGERCASPKCAIEKRGKPRASRAGRRRRVSDRGLQLREKQKARYIYGVLERQFRRLFAQADRSPGVTGDMLVQLLERRLDNVVFRLGFAESRFQARQIVRHGHIKVNGRKVDIPSYLVKTGDTVSWSESGAKTQLYHQAVEGGGSNIPPGWLNLDKSTFSGTVVSLPTRKDGETKFDEKAIVEYYSR